MAATLRLAHRGDHREEVENTLPALAAAIRVPGIDGVEFDVRLSRDGVPVVVHDADLGRVQGVPRRVRQLTASDLHDVGVPSLAEVLAGLPRRAHLDVELKEPLGRAGFEALAGGRGRDLDRAIVSSFLPDALEEIASRAPGWPRWLNVPWLGPEAVRVATELRCRGLAVEWRALDPTAIPHVRRAGLALAGWTVTRRPTRRRLERLELAFLCVEGAALEP